jgi:NAD(P)-dependent dehydrogenase (short-subunit alcohol dehydrogenase family)
MTRDKVALVTGVSSGIGRVTATLLAQHGFRVFGTMRNPSASHEASFELIPLDVREQESVRACVDGVLEKAGRIDALVNNAGYTLIGSAEEISLQETKDLFETNFFGVLRMTQAVLPMMRKQRSGRIAIIGSVAGFLPMPYQGIYAASKHAVEGYAESLDYEVQQFGIRVSVIEPGFVRTNIAENSRLAAQPLGVYAGDRDHVLRVLRESVANGEDPARVAFVVHEALTSSSPRARYTAGRQARFLSRVKRFAPAGLIERGVRKQFHLDAA